MNRHKLKQEVRGSPRRQYCYILYTNIPSSSVYIGSPLLAPFMMLLYIGCLVVTGALAWARLILIQHDIFNWTKHPIVCELTMESIKVTSELKLNMYLKSQLSMWNRREATNCFLLSCISHDRAYHTDGVFVISTVTVTTCISNSMKKIWAHAFLLIQAASILKIWAHAFFQKKTNISMGSIDLDIHLNKANQYIRVWE